MAVEPSAPYKYNCNETQESKREVTVRDSSVKANHRSVRRLEGKWEKEGRKVVSQNNGCLYLRLEEYILPRWPMLLGWTSQVIFSSSRGWQGCNQMNIRPASVE